MTADKRLTTAQSKIAAPIGRPMKPMNQVLNAASVPVSGSRLGKNRCGKINLAVARKKRSKF